MNCVCWFVGLCLILIKLMLLMWCQLWWLVTYTKQSVYFLSFFFYCVPRLWHLIYCANAGIGSLSLSLYLCITLSSSFALKIYWHICKAFIKKTTRSRFSDFTVCLCYVQEKSWQSYINVRNFMLKIYAKNIKSKSFNRFVAQRPKLYAR